MGMLDLLKELELCLAGKDWMRIITMKCRVDLYAARKMVSVPWILLDLVQLFVSERKA